MNTGFENERQLCFLINSRWVYLFWFSLLFFCGVLCRLSVLSEVTEKQNVLMKKGEVLFKLDPARYRARVNRLQADLVTAINNTQALKGLLDEASANTSRVSAERDRLHKDYQRYVRGSQAKVNPFSESDID